MRNRKKMRRVEEAMIEERNKKIAEGIKKKYGKSGKLEPPNTSRKESTIFIERLRIK